MVSSSSSSGSRIAQQVWQAGSASVPHKRLTVNATAATSNLHLIPQVCRLRPQKAALAHKHCFHWHSEKTATISTILTSTAVQQQ
jgi:hypothetical protein